MVSLCTAGEGSIPGGTTWELTDPIPLRADRSNPNLESRDCQRCENLPHVFENGVSM